MPRSTWKLTADFQGVSARQQSIDEPGFFYPYGETQAQVLGEQD